MTENQPSTPAQPDPIALHMEAVNSLARCRACLTANEPMYLRRASSYLSPRSCGQWRHIFAARGRSDDRVAFRVERDGRDVRPVARMA